jgi:glycine/D-amino acid oxidase-like deaminating enzyme
VDEEREVQGLRGFTGMVYNPLEGGLHSGKLVQGLYDRLVAKGVRFLFGHTVEHVHRLEGGLRAGLVTGKGRLVPMRCTRFLWAINAGLGKMDPFIHKIQPARGQILLSPPIDGLRLNGTFHFDEGYYYFRNYGSRLLLGGARNKAFQEEATDHVEPTLLIRQHLESFIEIHLPQVAKYLNAPGWMSWAGIMGKSTDNLPFVQEVSPDVYAAFACNGMGVALTPVMAEMAAQQLTNSKG